jgi:hypothetical protein
VRGRIESLKVALTYRADVAAIEASIVAHVHSSLARAAYNLDNLGAYQAVSLSCRDRLIDRWNQTQMYLTVKKRECRLCPHIDVN